MNNTEQNVRQEAADYVDTSTWSQQQREDYANYELRKAVENRSMKQLNMAIKNAVELEVIQCCKRSPTICPIQKNLSNLVETRS